MEEVKRIAEEKRKRRESEERRQVWIPLPYLSFFEIMTIATGHAV